MSELMEVYQPGDRFLTMTRRGEVQVWRVKDDGTIEPAFHDFATQPRILKDSPQA